MQSTGTFLGLTHDLSSINETGHVQFWARERLHDKVRDMLATAKVTGHFSRGAASKLYGLANFLEQGIYGRVGYGGLMAIKARQDETTSTITPEIEACFEVIEAVMRLQPKREFPVLHLDHLRFLAASDAAVEADNPGSGGFHLIFSSLTDHKFVTVLSRPTVQNYEHFGNLQRRISPNWNYLWCSTPLSKGLILFRNRRGLWFLDNVAAVMTLVRGRSSNADLAKLGHLIHLVCLHCEPKDIGSTSRARATGLTTSADLASMIHGGDAMVLNFTRRTSLQSCSSYPLQLSFSPSNTFSALGIECIG